MPVRASVDVHQHLWPPAFVDALRRRSKPPMMRGWTPYTAHEAPFEVDPADHDPDRRRALDPDRARILLSLSSPLCIERLRPDESQLLLHAWHDGLRELPRPFRG